MEERMNKGGGKGRENGRGTGRENERGKIKWE